MLCLISPAKSLDESSRWPEADLTLPRFAADAATLAAAAAKLGPKKLATLMHISDKLSVLNADRFRAFSPDPDGPAARPAIHIFAGDVYTGFEVKTLDAPAIAFAQDHVRILSGLYGLLRPLDLIQPYRLEMGTRWAPGRKKDLYAYWGDRIGKALAEDLAEQDSDVIINCASQEYWKAAAQALPTGVRVIEIDFREHGPSGLRFNTFAAKRGRGMMARYISEHRLSDVEALKNFDSDGYAFDAQGSEDGRWRFTRN